MHRGMKRNHIIYKVSTGLFCAFLLLTSIAYFTDPQFVTIYQHLGFPQYFREELGIAKMLGVVILLLPRVPVVVKEWVYAGFSIALISGAIAHICSGDPAGYSINVVWWLIVLLISYTFWHKLKQERAPTTSPQ